MAWDEWEQIKSQMAERNPAHMELNQVAMPDGGGGVYSGDSGGSGGSGTLRHHKQPWHDAADVADDLHTGMTHAKRDLDDAAKDTASGLTGLGLAGTLHTVRASWDDRLSAVRDECKSLHPKLLAVSRTLGETDQAVGDGVSSVHAPHSWTEK